MLMEALLIKNLFSKAQPSIKTEIEYSSSTPRGKSFYTIGTAVWTTNGKWIEGSAQKLRLMVGDHPQGFVAMQEPGDKGLYQRLRDQFTHVSVKTKAVDGGAENLSINLGSLSKRTQLSVATILLMRICGKLTFDYIEQNVKKAQQNHAVFEQMIQNGRAHAIALGQDPDKKAKELREVLQTVVKSRRLARGILVQKGSSTYIAHQDKNKKFILGERRDLLGEGTYGIVYEVLNLATGELQAVKFAKKADKKEGIKNENAILCKVHNGGHVVGIQKAPHVVIDLLHPEYGQGYVTTKYDYNLNDLDFLKLTPTEEKLIGSQSLFNGLSWLHKKKIVHCDIKPANCCSDDKELQIADFGHAREFDQVSPEQPLGVCTPYFTSKNDQRENMRISLSYCMHQIAVGNVKNPLAKAWVLKSAIDHPTFNIDRQAAKFTIASILRKISHEKLNALGISANVYKSEMDLLKSNPKKIPIRYLDMSSFNLNQAKMEKLKQESIILCQRHDVYGLAITVLCFYLGCRYISPRSLNASIARLAKLPELQSVNPGLTELLKAMLNPDAAKRPTVEEAKKRYDAFVSEILSKRSRKPIADQTVKKRSNKTKGGYI